LASAIERTTLEVIYMAVCDTYPEEVRDAVDIHRINQGLQRGKIPTFLSAYCGKKLAGLSAPKVEHA